MNSLTVETTELLAAIESLGFPPLHTLSPRKARVLRESSAALNSTPAEPVATVEDIALDTAGDPVPVRVYTPMGHEPGMGTFVYFHGGGWVLGNLDTHDALARGLANASGMQVRSVGYRLAPEFPHPAALEDAWSATCWAADSCHGPLVVGGDSAGGHLATCVAARARSEGPRLAAQILIYPVTDLSSFQTRSYSTYQDGYWLTRAAMEWFRKHYVHAEADLQDPDVSPLLRSDLSDMPPTVVVAAECDVLADEGVRYAERLEEAGVDVTMLRYAGVIHGFAALPDAIPEGRHAIGAIGHWLRERLAGGS